MLRTPAPETPAIDRSACPSTRGHGTAHYRYRHGCTCPDGERDAKQHRWRVHTRKLITDKLVSSAGTARRLQAAAYRGHPLNQVCAALEMNQAQVYRLREQVQPTVTRDLARRVARVVGELHELPEPADPPASGSGRNGVARTRAHARRKGWAPLGLWDDIDDPDERPDRSYLRDGIVRNDDGNGCKILAEDQIDAIRAAYRAAAPGTWETLAVAEQYGVRDGAVREALRGTLVAGYTDVVAELGVKWGHPGGPAASITDDVIYAVRADYLAGTPWSQLGPRHGVSKTLAARIVHGRIRPHLGLEDLTAHKRGDNTAATPTSRETGKESAA